MVSTFLGPENLFKYGTVLFKFVAKEPFELKIFISFSPYKLLRLVLCNNDLVVVLLLQ
jgi:hypothetical protein